MPEDLRIAGHRVLRLEEVDSTNALARRLLAEGRLAPGDAVVAERQTAGRGRRGREWVTVPGRSLAVSIVLAEPPLERPARLTVIAAVAAARALERAGAAPIAIKWPNDLMRGDAKCGGLLVERVAAPGGGTCCVLGLGVNLELRDGDLPPELAGRAGAAGLPADDASRLRLLGALLEELDAALAAAAGGADGGLAAEYRRRSWLTGRRVELIASGERLEARIADVTGDGDLVLEDGRVLQGERVELLAAHAPPERAPSR